jgi:hypothetical protein
VRDEEEKEKLEHNKIIFNKIEILLEYVVKK